MHRRDFLKLAATSGAGAVVFTGCNMTKYAGTWGDGDPAHEFKEESTVLNPNDLPYHRDAWYATAHPRYGSGLVVRVFEGRARKVDGNPVFPTTLGRSMAFEQALLQEVYHPDRIPSPMQARYGAARGSGQFDPINDQGAALGQFYSLINGAKGGSGSIVLLTGPVSGSRLAIINEFARATGASHQMVDRDEMVVLREAMRRVFGVSTLPSMDLARARTIVSFSADFLTDWLSPIQFQAAYGEFRQGAQNGGRGVFWYVGPQFSATAASADHWIPTKPGMEGYVALAVANALGGGAAAAYPGVALDQFAPETIGARVAATGADPTKVADQIRALANDFKNGPSIAIAGGAGAAQTNGLFNVAAPLALNLASGNVGKPGGLILNPPSPSTDLLPNMPQAVPYKNLPNIAGALQSAKVILISDLNPVFALPGNPSLRDMLHNTGARVVSFSPFFDETAMVSDLILPDLTTLESWGAYSPEPGPGYPTVALQQPVVQPFVKGVPFGDVLLGAAKVAGGSPRWATTQEAVMAAITGLAGAGGNITAGDPKAFFVQAQAQGGWWKPPARGASTIGVAPASAPTNVPGPADPTFEGNNDQYPYFLLPYTHSNLGRGEMSHLPWLQGLPEPITTAVWNTWVELNPKTAASLGVDMGDVVKVISPAGQIEVPVFVNPAAAPDAALIPMGQGHSSMSRYAEKRGVNPLTLVATQRQDAQTGALAWGATRVTLVKADRKVRLAMFQGAIQPYQIEGFPIVQTTLPRTS